MLTRAEARGAGIDVGSTVWLAPHRGAQSMPSALPLAAVQDR